MNSIATAYTAINVPFHGANLYVISHNGEPYTPMKPIVEGMGMDWASQFTKLKRRFASTIVEITTVADDGKPRTMICLALRKLAGWLNTISPNKVKPEIRDRVIQYQDECDDVLYEYWTKGEVTNPHKTTTDQRTPLRDAVNMLVSKKHLMYSEAYAMIHQRFGVASIEDLALEQIPLAIEYVHKIVLEGDLITREEQKQMPMAHPEHKNCRVMYTYNERGVIIGTRLVEPDEQLTTPKSAVEYMQAQFKKMGVIMLREVDVAKLRF